ncbi:transketolase [Undibacterium cyanobacteriorum]|uniref:Transketolase n=1 Tax=Undibacterium cyanobacteriorum TaxID=3073561 RepID=A0ABY9RIB1_9BURK|nr:transketolase [Undibacterium sp. 20NA77.5]WMW80954.1 transketolase [Undibacterium sp. 20NA77.5]
MRNAASLVWQKLFEQQEYAFITGDLGFMALEPVRDKLGKWFINGGISEQNIVSMAAGMSKMGVQTWVYSIAPFIYARPFEQIRNDVCLNQLPVRLVGNGGGYAYGSMGSSHHAIEDYGAMLTLQGMQVYVPAFAEDVEDAVWCMAKREQPAYLRLGRCEKPKDFVLPAYAPWRQLIEGDRHIIVVVGPLAGGFIAPLLALPREQRPALWVLSELPYGFEHLPPLLLQGLANQRELVVVEEHVAHGSAGHHLLASLHQRGIAPAGFRHFCAQGYPSAYYGSQVFHRAESSIDAISVLRALQE